MPRARDQLSGILNGIDYAYWDPSTDTALRHVYSAASPLAEREQNKASLLQETGLDATSDRALFVMVSRLVAQKGVDIMLNAFDEIMSLPMTLIVLGTGDLELEAALQARMADPQGRFALIGRFDEGLAHRMYAGSDFFLMPSRFEPCGLSQMIALRYGSIPVVRRTGGLKDTVQDVHPKTGVGNGISFDEATPSAFLDAVQRAVQLYADRDARSDASRLIGMACDFSWQASARDYLETLHVHGGVLMKAVILAGGFGTRLRPLTINLPKPMVPFANRPMMLHIVGLLKKHGFDDLVVILYHQPDAIRGYFGDGSDFGVKIEYVTSQEDLGTAGAVGLARASLQETFLVIAADIVTDIDLTKAVQYHREHKAAATITLSRVEDPLEYGIVITDPEGHVVRFLEKPSWGEVFSDTVNTGIYVLEPSVWDDIPEDKEVDFSKNLFPALLAHNQPLYGYIAPGYWRDVGNIREYKHAHGDLLKGKVDLGAPG